MITKQKKLKRAVEMRQADEQGKSAWILLSRLDELEEQMSNIKIPDNADIKNELKKIKQELEKEMEIELSII